MVRAGSVTFNENIIPHDFMVDSEPLQTLELSIEGCIDIEQPSTTKTSEARSPPTEGDTADSVGATEKNQAEEEAVDSHSTDHRVQRSVRIRNPPIRYGLAYDNASVTEIQEPRGYSEEVSGPEKEQWLDIMVLEAKSSETMGTRTLVDRPQSRTCVSSVAWRTIWIEATDGNWIQRVRKASSSGTTRRAKPTC